MCKKTFLWSCLSNITERFNGALNYRVSELAGKVFKNNKMILPDLLLPLMLAPSLMADSLASCDKFYITSIFLL